MHTRPLRCCSRS